MHPVCTNCQRRELDCIYELRSSPNPTPDGSSSSSSAHAPSTRIEVQSLLSTPPPHTPTQSESFLHLLRHTISRQPSPHATRLDLTRLELIHQYTSVTYASFSNHPEWNLVWRDKIPQLFTSPYVLHATLAISALHLSFLNKERSVHYQDLANSYYHDASVSLRNAIPSVTKQDPNALFVASVFIAIYVFACPTVVRHDDDPRALTWFPVLRGIPAVTRGVKDVLRELAPAVSAQALRPPARASTLPPLPENLDRLYDGIEDPEERAIYIHATATLKYSWELHRIASNEFWLGAAFIWPAKMDDGFVHLMVERRPPALVLLAYYNAMFSMLGGVWWIGSRAKEELAVIERILDKDWAREWLPWVRGLVGSGCESVS